MKEKAMRKNKQMQNPKYLMQFLKTKRTDEDGVNDSKVFEIREGKN